MILHCGWPRSFKVRGFFLSFLLLHVIIRFA
nr:MAG TPA_asm: hypothetical protein [Caudoviricetes sp.]